MKSFVASLVLALVGCAPRASTEPAPPPPAPETSAAHGSAADRGRPGSETVGVTGVWTLEVRDPDGTVAQRTEFHNAFDGATVVSLILSRQRTVGYWAVVLDNTGICQTYCALVSGGAEDLPDRALGLQVSKVGTDIRLVGSFTAPAAGTLLGVNSWIYVCAPGENPEQCNDVAEQSASFSRRELAVGEQIDVKAGQIINVEATFSWGTG